MPIKKKKISAAIKIEEKRKFIRHPMCFPLKFSLIKKGSALDIASEASITKNVSKGGLLFTASRSVKPGSAIIAQVPFQDKIFHVHARVAHCTPIPGTALFDIGIRFLRYNDAFKVRLIEQMYLISEYRDLRSLQEGRDINLQQASKEWIQRYSARFKRLYW